jgi:hypothetical protein
MNYEKQSKKISLAIILLVVILTIIALFFINKKYKAPIIEVPIIKHQTTQPVTQSTSPLTTNYPLPTTYFLPVPFTPQAPTANWDELHNEACEEASTIMASEYFLENKNTQLSPEPVEEQILKLTEWQQKTFGYHLSITTEETAKMIREFYSLNTEIKTNYTDNDLKQALVDGKLIIFPTNGQKLNNPYYKRPGPLYHMLVIKGYDSQGNFLTNDPGTKHGLNYPYTFDVLYNANGTYTPNTKTVDLQQKNLLLISAPKKLKN